MQNKPHVFVKTIEELQATLAYLAQAGWTGFDCSDARIDVLNRWGTGRVAKKETLAQIRQELGDCRRCKLAAHRSNIVFGSGHAGARLVFIGEGPGYDEDQQGLPFVGAAGGLLTRIIEAIKLNRDQVYICNIVKCRPPGNRNPESDEVDTCYPFLKRQLKAIAPEYICALGGIAAQTLLNTSKPISKLRGRFHDYHGISLLPTYHPAYLLRNPGKKRDVWEDMKMLMKAMGIE